MFHIREGLDNLRSIELLLNIEFYKDLNLFITDKKQSVYKWNDSYKNDDVSGVPQRGSGPLLVLQTKKSAFRDI